MKYALLSRVSRQRLCLFAFAAAGIVVLFAVAINARPPVVLSVVGTETRVFKVEPATNVTFISVHLQMTNRGKRPIGFYCAEYGFTVYTVLTRTNGVWKESWSPGCGVRERTLAPGQTVTFKALAMDPSECFRIGVPYCTCRLKRKIELFYPAWLLRHVAWLQRDPMVTTPTVNTT